MPTKGTMSFAQDIFDAFDNHWRGEKEGIWRPSYSLQENEAIESIKEKSSSLGMEGYQDLAGNAYFVYPGKNRNAPVIMMGSHVDAVPKGGRWDGTAGVFAGMAAVKYIHEMGKKPPQDIVVSIFRGEESAWFNNALLGSQLACGDLSDDILLTKRNDTQKTLGHHMTDVGLNVSALEEKILHGESLLPLDRIGFFIETHIEQSGTLVEAGVDLGIVTGIRGNARFPDMVSFYGKAAHTGSTPQLKRQDSSLAAAYYQVYLDQSFKKMVSEGKDIVWAFPQGGVVNGAPTTVPEQYNIRPEVRSLDPHVLQEVKEEFHRCAQQAAKENNVILGDNIRNIVLNDPVLLDKNLQGILQKSAKKLGISFNALPSGSGHDAAALAKNGIVSGMLFIPHGNGGISHNPNEIMTLSPNEDPFSLAGSFNKAVRIMSDIIMKHSFSEMKLGLPFVESLKKRGAIPLP